MMRRLLSNDVALVGAVLVSIVVVGWLAAMIAIFPDRFLEAPRAEVRGGNQSCDSDGYGADVESYADSYDLAPKEAARRMCLQAVSDTSAGLDVVRELKRLARDRFVIALPVHEPEFGLLVSFTGSSVPTGAQAIADKAPLPVIVRAGAPYGEPDIMRIRDEIDAGLRDHPSYLSCDYDYVDERFEIRLHASDAQVSYLRFTLPSLPDGTAGQIRVRASVPMVAQPGGNAG